MEICEKNSLNEKELFRFLNSRYQKARSTAPDLINEVARIDARFVADFCRRIKLQEGIFIKISELLAEAIISLNTARMTRHRKAGLPFHCGSRNLGVKVANHWHNITRNPKRAQFIGYLWVDGRLTNAKRRSRAALLQSEAYRDAVQTQLIANMADYYYRLLSLDAQTAVTEQAVERYREQVRVMRALKGRR